MPAPTFLDTNVQIYAAGRPHLLQQPCVEVLEMTIDHPDAFFTDAEVFQELLHRYSAIRAWEPLGKESFESFGEVMDGRVEPIYLADVERAASLKAAHPGLDARDLLHVAVMQRVGAAQMISTDTGFDQVADIMRLDPADVDAWRDDLLSSSAL